MKKVIVGIIGCGTIANSAHIPAYLKNEDVEIKYFCDIIPERAKAAVEKYGCGIGSLKDSSITPIEKSYIYLSLLYKPGRSVLPARRRCFYSTTSRCVSAES